MGRIPLMEHDKKNINFLMRRKFEPENRNVNIKQHKPKVCIISTIPRSGTWSMQYFWAVYNALNESSDYFDPFGPFIMRLGGLGADLFVVAHLFCPDYKKHLSLDLKEKLVGTSAANAPGYDWASDHIISHNWLDVCNPLRNDHAKIVFVYRNPLDQITSYARRLWNDSARKQKDPKSITFLLDKHGKRIYVDSVNQFIRLGGAASYFRSFMTYYIMKDRLADKLMFVKYEDIVRSRETKLVEIAHFLLDDVGVCNIDEKNLQLAANMTRIENLKKIETLTGKGISHHEGSPKGQHIFNGSIGQWKEALKDDDVDYVLSYLDAFDIPRNYFTFE